MGSSVPMALLRPSCAALRPSASPVSHQWTAVTRAFARQFCSQQSSCSAINRPSILSSIQLNRNRSFSSATQRSAKVLPNKPTATTPAAAKKRKVQIGYLPKGEVDWRTIRRIFGDDVTHGIGNNVLRIIHHRRTSGSLADYGVDNLGHAYTSVNHKMAVKALEWLRKEYPIDEARAAEEWAEKEANRISYELWLADPENADSKYNDPARVYREQQQEIEEQKQNEGKRIGLLRVGPSEFELNIKRKRQERLAEMARKAEEKEQRDQEDEKKLASGEWVRTPRGTALMKPGQDTYVDVFGREQVSRRKEMIEYYQKKSQSPFKSAEEMLAKTTTAQRLVPMTALVAAVCLLSYGFAHYYVPPSPEYRLWSDVSITTATVAAIVGTNVLVCMLWRFNPLWPFMTKYFMHVPGYPRAVQAVLNVFSHVQYEHLISNMMFFGLIGTACHELVDRGVFLGTYISAGAVGTLVSLYWANLGRGNITAHSVGASAAIWGIATLFCLLTDKETIKVPFVKDMEVGFWPKTLICAFIVMEVWNAAKKGASTMDHASHFGGILVGGTVAGYLNATGFHQRRRLDLAAAEGSKTMDVGALVKAEVDEVKEGVKKAVKK